MRLRIVHVPDLPRELPRVPRHLARVALLVAVLGVLPVVLDASVAWQVLGPVVAVAFLWHGLRLVWREVCSTAPRHLSRH
jgi:hypothetical protein